MVKKTLITLLIIGIIATSVWLVIENKQKLIKFFEKPEKITPEFIECLKEQGVVIYGSSVCPSCANLEKEYGGLKRIKPIYLDCSGLGEEWEKERCLEETQTGFTPEIQIKGELLVGWGSPEVLAEKTGCEIY